MPEPTEKQVEAMAEKLLTKFPGEADPMSTYGQARYVLSLLLPLVEAADEGIICRHASQCPGCLKRFHAALSAARKEGIIP